MRVQDSSTATFEWPQPYPAVKDRVHAAMRCAYSSQRSAMPPRPPKQNRIGIRRRYLAETWCGLCLRFFHIFSSFYTP